MLLLRVVAHGKMNYNASWEWNFVTSRGPPVFSKTVSTRIKEDIET